MVDVYNFSNYRNFLREMLTANKHGPEKVSLGTISRKSGAVSKAYLSLVLSGKRALSAKKVSQVGSALGLRGPRLHYFENLVRFNEAKRADEREHFLEKLIEVRPKTHPRILDYEQYTVLSSWQPLIIRELIRVGGAGNDPLFIYKKLQGRATLREITSALQRLEKAKLIRKDTSGNWHVVDQEVRSSDEIQSLAIQRYHRSCLNLAKNFLETESLANREFGSINISLRQEDIPRLKQKLKLFRDELLQESTIDKDDTTCICQINFQFLKIT